MSNSWQKKHLGDIAKISSGKMISSKEISDTYSKGLYPCYGGNGLRGYVKNYLYNGQYPIIGRVGALCGNVHLTNGPFFPTEHALVVSIKTNDDPRFIEYLLKSMNLNQYAKGVAQPVLSASTISELSAYFPPISEQKGIVAELDLLSGIIEKKNAQLLTLDELSNTLFYEMFGNPVSNDKAWASEKMKDIAPQKAYSGHIPANNGMQWLLNLDMVESQTGKIIEKVLFSSADIGNSTTTFSEDNILYSKLRPYLNKVVIPDEPGYCTSELVPLLPKKGVINRIFLAYLLRSKFFVDYINTRVAGAKMPRITMSDFWEFDIIIPPLKLQESFAEKISAIEKQKSLIRTSLSPAEDLLAARMDEYFC